MTPERLAEFDIALGMFRQAYPGSFGEMVSELRAYVDELLGAREQPGACLLGRCPSCERRVPLERPGVIASHCIEGAHIECDGAGRAPQHENPALRATIDGGVPTPDTTAAAAVTETLGRCPACLRRVPLERPGVIASHCIESTAYECAGTGRPPRPKYVERVTLDGTSFDAPMHDEYGRGTGASQCAGCGQTLAGYVHFLDGRFLCLTCTLATGLVSINKVRGVLGLPPFADPAFDEPLPPRPSLATMLAEVGAAVLAQVGVLTREELAADVTGAGTPRTFVGRCRGCTEPVYMTLPTGAVDGALTGDGIYCASCYTARTEAAAETPAAEG